MFTLFRILSVLLPFTFATELCAELVDLSGYNNVHYVDATAGGSNANTHSSVFAAVTAAASGDAVFVREGRFDVTSYGSSGVFGTGTGLNNLGKNVDFIGVPGRSILTIDGAAVSTRDVYMYSGEGLSHVYGLTIERDSAGRTSNFSNAIFANGAVQGRFFNTVFRSTNSPSTALTYDNGNLADIVVRNSVFDLDSDLVQPFTGQNAAVYNSAFSNSITDSRNTFANNLTDASFDSDYNILGDSSLWIDGGTGFDRDGSAADIGVYGGPQSWSAVAVPETTSFSLVAIGSIVVMLSRHRRLSLPRSGRRS
ncbi:hypothetical protein N9N28_03000 [Rubripirellula amarantea]|nr:hypothetical protein [Rubripirellula amarantea]